MIQCMVFTQHSTFPCSKHPFSHWFPSLGDKMCLMRKYILILLQRWSNFGPKWQREPHQNIRITCVFPKVTDEFQVSLFCFSVIIKIASGSGKNLLLHFFHQIICIGQLWDWSSSWPVLCGQYLTHQIKPLFSLFKKVIHYFYGIQRKQHFTIYQLFTNLSCNCSHHVLRSNITLNNQMQKKCFINKCQYF